MILISLFSISILFHELFKFCIQGRYYFQSNFSPVFGLKLPSWAIELNHYLLILTCGTIAIFPAYYFLLPLQFVTLLIVILTYPIRLSNHLIFMLFFCASLLCGLYFQDLGDRGHELSELSVFLIRYLIISVYFYSVWSKLNKVYLSSSTSCAEYVFLRYVEHKKLIKGPKAPPIIKILAKASVLVEVIIPLLLLINFGAGYGILAGLFFHFMLGIFGFAHFSSLMYTSLLAFISVEKINAIDVPESLTQSPMIFILIIGFVLGVIIGPYAGYLKTKTARLLFGFFGLITLGSLFWVIQQPYLFQPQSLPLPEHIPGLAIVIVCLFLLNGISPYIGLKMEYSFIMLSNLRPDYWNHIIQRNPPKWIIKPHYIDVTKINGLDELEEPSDRETKIALDILKQWKTQRFSPYLFFSCLKKLKPHLRSGQMMEVSYRRKQVDFEIRLVFGKKLEIPRDYIPMHLYPSTASKDPADLHCK